MNVLPTTFSSSIWRVADPPFPFPPHITIYLLNGNMTKLAAES